MRTPLGAGLALAILLAAPSARAVQPPAGPAGLRRVGGLVAPRSFEFSSLPRWQGVPSANPREGHPEGVFPEAERELERLKRHPQGPNVGQMGRVTLDRAAGAFQAMAPQPGVGFEGITQGAYIPSEPSVGAGPLNVFSAGNVSVTVTNKDGTNRVETDGQAFFGIPAAEGAISDAQCYFDAVHGRFVALAFTQGTSPSDYSNFYLAISKTNDARGAWWLYKFDMTKDGSTATTNWSDYEALGVSEDKIAMTAQQFSFSGNTYQYQKIRILDRAAAYAGGSIGYVDIFNFAPPPGGDQGDVFVTKAGRNLSAGDATLHLLCIRTNGGTNVTYREVTGPPASPALSAGTRVTVSAYSAPPDAAQKGSSKLVATNDCRPTDFVVRGGVLVCAFHTAANFGSGQVSALRLLRLRTSDQAVLTDETYGANGVFEYYPAATVDSAGTIFLGFDRSSSSEYPSDYATGKRRSDAAIEPSTLLKAGVSATTQSRWGDFTGIDNDASQQGPAGTVAWYGGQWTKATNTFGTWINRLSYTYGQLAGTVLDDCDGSAATTADRQPLAGATVTLQQGASILLSATTDTSGAFAFGYLESGTYDLVVTPPGGGASVDALPGSGGTTQVRVGPGDLQVGLTDSQLSSGNTFVVTSAHAAPAPVSLAPATRAEGDTAFTLTVSGAGFVRCSIVRVDGADRPTTWVSAGQLSAAIPASDIAVSGTRAITVFSPAPGGGLSASLPLAVTGPDLAPPTVTVTSPNGGETWKAGSQHPITWTAQDNIGVASVDLAYSSDGGATYPNTIASGLGNGGTYPWTVPDAPGTALRVRAVAHDAAGNSGADASDTTFAVDRWIVTASAGPGGTIAPSGAVGVVEGASVAFAITPDSTHHVADVLVDGASVGAVHADTLAHVAANHTIAASFAGNAVRLTLQVSGGGTVSRAPDAPSYPPGTNVVLTPSPAAGWAFAGWGGALSGLASPASLVIVADTTVTAAFADTAAPAVHVTAPNGGEVLIAGSTAPLTWTATDNAAVTAVDLYLSRTGASGPFDTLAAGLANTGSYGWLVSGPATSDAWLRAVAHDAAGNAGADLSDAAFTIGGTLGVGDGPVTAFALLPVRPNPARGGASFGFAQPRAARAHLAILDLQGRQIAVLADGEYAAGRHEVAWRPGAGRIGAGLYFARLRIAGRTFTTRFALVR